MKPRRFRLDVVGDLEDRPRLLRAYGRIRGSELAVVLRPTEHRALFVVLGKASCVLWTHELEPGEKRTVGKLRLGKKTEIQVGSKLLQIVGELPAGVANGQVVPVAVKNARVRVLVGGDAPRVGKDEVNTAAAVARVKAMQRGLPPKGPMTLRGRWTGALIWDHGAPSIELKRKLAAYGTLICRSSSLGWSWSFERSGRWYGAEKQQEGAGLSTLMEAIEGGITAAMLLVKEACGFRDTRRRAAIDEDWATRHPIPTPKPRANPVLKLGVKGCGCSKRAGTAEPSGESAKARRLVREATERAGEGERRAAGELLAEAGHPRASPSGSKANGVHGAIDAVRETLEPSGGGSKVEQAKDQLLLGAFRDAVRSALRG